jgi:hypothetical protein
MSTDNTRQSVYYGVKDCLTIDERKEFDELASFCGEGFLFNLLLLAAKHGYDVCKYEVGKRLPHDMINKQYLD